MTYIVIGLSALLLIVLLIKIAIAMADEMGKIREQEERLKKDMDLAKKRAEEMLKEQSNAQTISDLRDGKF